MTPDRSGCPDPAGDPGYTCPAGMTCTQRHACLRRKVDREERQFVLAVARQDTEDRLHALARRLPHGGYSP